jgi:hypothetical protein
VTDVRIEGPDGQPRDMFVAGDPFVVKLHVQPRETVEPPRLLIELRDASGALLGRAERGLGELGWDGTDADIRFEVESLPLVEGRFQLNVALTDASHTRRYHSVEKAAEFTVDPQGESRGFFMFDGEWALEPAESGTRSVEVETA